ncbi:MAG: hypothetical protein DWQ36_01845 [Acidobacteria bacterium]|nr:MAG: hypothetical protein DWQ30_16690 [Acidobacteriota bacterium]REK11512.1 MAG: hypothetical protein DWQ36_01845 [Acidobacteriota bacterium]
MTTRVLLVLILSAQQFWLSAAGAGQGAPAQRGGPGPTPPIAIPDAYAVAANEALVVSAPGLRANDYDPDGDPFIVSNFFPPTHGTLTSVVTSGAFTYSPAPGFVGTDSFSYRLKKVEANIYSNWATVTIVVYSDPNRPPVAVADHYGTPFGQTLSVAAPGVLANDYDPDGDPILATHFFAPVNGTLTAFVTSGSFTYVPRPAFRGVDVFSYRIRDSQMLFSSFVPVRIFVGVDPATFVFGDGFESGGTAAWSATVP